MLLKGVPIRFSAKIRKWKVPLAKWYLPRGGRRHKTRGGALKCGGRFETGACEPARPSAHLLENFTGRAGFSPGRTLKGGRANLRGPRRICGGFLSEDPETGAGEIARPSVHLLESPGGLHPSVSKYSPWGGIRGPDATAPARLREGANLPCWGPPGATGTSWTWSGCLPNPRRWPPRGSRRHSRVRP